MSQHEQFTIDTGMQVFFAHPDSPWERGANENTNGLIRQYFPNGNDFAQVSEEEIKKAQRKLNDRPRKVLNCYKPNEVFNNLVALKIKMDPKIEYPNSTIMQPFFCKFESEIPSFL